MKYSGSCHCGNIRYEVEGTIESVGDCNCSHCRRKGYLLWFVGGEQMTLLTPDAPMGTYTFNHHRIRHRFCPNCGCAPFAMGQSPDGKPSYAVNVRCLPEVEPGDLIINKIDGKSF